VLIHSIQANLPKRARREKEKRKGGKKGSRRDLGAACSVSLICPGPSGSNGEGGERKRRKKEKRREKKKGGGR